jgi:hypothetical protein
MKIVSLFAILLTFTLGAQTTIILDPAGDSSTPGRQLYESYERAQTYDCAQELKKILELSFNFRVIITRVPGQTLEPFQAITLANQQGNFLVRLHFFKDTHEQPQLFGYRLFFDPVFDAAPHTLDPQSFIHIHQAHFIASTTTTFLCNKIKHELTIDVNQKLFDFYGVYGIPVKPLVGCSIPAMLFDIGINNDTAWQQLVSPLAQAIASSFL